MPRRPNLLLVAPTPRVVTTVFPWLESRGCDVTIATSFATAKTQLEEDPALVISDVQLADYNGLQLALRARSRGIPTIILGNADPVLQRDASQLGAVYLTHETDPSELLDAVDELIGSTLEESEPVAVGARVH